MKSNYKVRLRKCILTTLVAVIVISLSAYLYWLYSPSSTPRDAIIKYCRAKSLIYSQQNVKVQESEYVDKNYGRQFIVEGVTGEFGDSISFFYLKDNGGWIVVCAGTGP